MKVFEQPQRIQRGFLAEEYDGIGKYVKVTLSRTSTAAAMKARVAAGDFGGGRRFPVGTPVTVFSIHGRLEVGLGNNPCVRYWRLPIEILVRGRIDYGSLTDFQMDFEVDLLDGLWTPATAWGLLSHAGMNLQNQGATIPEQYIFSYGAGEAGAWVDENPSSEVLAWTEGDQKNFFMRLLIEQYRVSTKAWLATDTEPASYQYYRYDASETKPFGSSGDHTLYIFRDSSKQPVDMNLDWIHILRGYGNSPFLIDQFNRIEVNGHGNSNVPGQAWVVDASPAEFLCDGEYGIWRRDDAGDPTSDIIYLQLPDGVIPCSAGRGTPIDAADGGSICGDEFNTDSGTSWPGWSTDIASSALSVSSGYAHFEDTSDFQGGYIWLPQSLGLSIEILVHMKFRWTKDAELWQYGIGIGEDDFSAGTEFAICYFDVSRGAGPPWTYTLNASPQNSQGLSDTFATSITKVISGTGVVGELDLMMRLRVESGALRMKVWETAGSEPGAWTSELTGGTLPDIMGSIGMDLANDTNFVDETSSLQVDYVQVVEGCV